MTTLLYDHKGKTVVAYKVSLRLTKRQPANPGKYIPVIFQKDFSEAIVTGSCC
jgi:hypothetical protein